MNSLAIADYVFWTIWEWFHLLITQHIALDIHNNVCMWCGMFVLLNYWTSYAVICAMNDICTRRKYFFVRHTHVIQPKDVHIYMMYVYMLRKMFPCQNTVPLTPIHQFYSVKWKVELSIICTPTFIPYIFQHPDGGLALSYKKKNYTPFRYTQRYDIDLSHHVRSLQFSWKRIILFKSK